MAKSNSVIKTKSTRSSGLIILDLETECPVINLFDRYKLPTYKDVIGLFRKISTNEIHEHAITKVADSLWRHWTGQNIYPITFKSVRYRVQNMIDEYKDLKEKQSSRSESKSWQTKAERFLNKKDKLFDIFCEDKCARLKLEMEHKVPMSEMDFEYLKSMRTDRKATCDSKIDKKFHEKEQKKKKIMNTTFRYKRVIYLQPYHLKMMTLHLMVIIKMSIDLNLKIMTFRLEKD